MLGFRLGGGSLGLVGFRVFQLISFAVCESGFVFLMVFVFFLLWLRLFNAFRGNRRTEDLGRTNGFSMCRLDPGRDRHFHHRRPTTLSAAGSRSMRPA